MIDVRKERHATNTRERTNITHYDRFAGHTTTKSHYIILRNQGLYYCHSFLAYIKINNNDDGDHTAGEQHQERAPLCEL
jgi:hypothetical protein